MGTVARRAAATLFAATAVASAYPAGASAVPTPVASTGGMVRLDAIELGCSIGFGGHDRTGSAVIVTAGHCAPSTPRIGIPAFLGQDMRADGYLVAHSPLEVLDYSAIRLRPGIAVNVGPIGTPKRIGQRVCKVGRTSGRTCGRISAITRSTITVAGIRVLWGDSGGALKDTAGRTIGIVSRGQGTGLQAHLDVLGGITGLREPIPTIFPRADVIASRLSTQIGFR